MNFACIRTPHRAAVSRCWHGLTRLTSDSSAWPGRAIAAFLLLAAAPFLLVAVLLGADLRVQTRVGRWGNLIKLYVLWVCGKSCELPGILWAIAAGEMSWVGPEARPVGVLDRRLEVDRKVNSVLPGLICDWWVRKRTNIH